jgi:DNA-binding response OmpR family regulator
MPPGKAQTVLVVEDEASIASFVSLYLSKAGFVIDKDKDVKTAAPIGREELISFLSVSTCLLSFAGLTHAMKRAIYEISANATAHYAVTDSPLTL